MTDNLAKTLWEIVQMRLNLGALPGITSENEQQFGEWTWIHRPDERQFVTDLPNNASAPGVKAALERRVSVPGSD